jgi:hypothetical protein
VALVVIGAVGISPDEQWLFLELNFKVLFKVLNDVAQIYVVSGLPLLQTDI